MWKRFASLILALSLGASIAVGLPLHSSERGCNMPMQMNSCGDMEMEPTAPGVTSAALCCLVDCPEPGPTGSAFTFQGPSLNNSFLHQVAWVPPLNLSKERGQSKWLHSSSFTPPYTYLKNLALLI